MNGENVKKILVAGSVNIDLVVGVPSIPKRGETIMSRSFKKAPGGKGANQACACGRLGGGCVFLGRVGDDGSGRSVLDSLEGAGVDVSRVEEAEGLTTGTAFITVGEDGENSIVVIPGANLACDDGYFDRNSDALDGSDVVLTQLETPVQSIWRLLGRAKAAGKTTILNPAPAPDFIPDEVLSGLDFLTPNETELGRLSGMPAETMPQIELAARSLLKKGVKNVIVTMGEKGALLCRGDGCSPYPAFKCDPVDTTAAGDTFNAALAVALCEGRTVGDAILFANAAASISVTREGAQTSVPTREETESLVKSTRL